MILIPAYLPPISYFKNLITQNELSFCINTNYQKQTYRNRCVIYGANGRQNLIIPIARNVIKKEDKVVPIYNKIAWQKNHWKSIESAYKSSPFFEYYQDELKPFFMEKHKLLFDYNVKLIIQIFSILDLSIKINEVNHIEDFKEINHLLNPKKDLTKFKFYNQVFQNKKGFQSDLSIIDLLFNLGPESSDYIKSL
jgi:acetone carboxylase gamma subunit